MKSMKRVLQGLLAGLAFCAVAARAAVGFTVSFDDPAGQFAAYEARIVSNLLAAGADWSSHLTGNATIDLVVGFDAGIPTANGASVTSSFVGNNGSFNVFEQGAAAEVRTGIDPNGAGFDGRITLGASYLQNELFFDPDPLLRTTPVPGDRTDAVSVFLHELGHVFAFSGWRNYADGTFPGDYESSFDELTTFDGSNFFFVGPQAESVYGGPVPLTFANGGHLGNSSPRPGADLLSDLMNGIVYYRGTRYGISSLDVAVLCDVGVPGPSCLAPPVPEPDTSRLLGCGLLALAGLGWARRRGDGREARPCA